MRTHKTIYTEAELATMEPAIARQYRRRAQANNPEWQQQRRKDLARWIIASKAEAKAIEAGAPAESGSTDPQGRGGSEPAQRSRVQSGRAVNDRKPTGRNLADDIRSAGGA